MLNWLYKKFTTHSPPSAQTAKQPTSAAAPKPALQPQVDWAGRLLAARGDDAALLSLAQSADVLAIKIEAVQALASEEALKQAERQLRNHDRKVHRLCKQRLAAVVSQREARSQALELLARSRALLAEVVVPANHLVTLDRHWAALPEALLEPQQRTEFAALRAELDRLVRERSEALRQQQRQWQQWAADVQQRLQAWTPQVMAAAEHGSADDLTPMHSALQALRDTRPAANAAFELEPALAQALHTTTLVQARLVWLQAPQPTAGDAPNAEVGSTPAPDIPRSSWEALPALPDRTLAQLLNQRHARWLQAQRPDKAADLRPPRSSIQAPRAAQPAPLDEAQRLHLDSLAQQAEAAQLEGHVSASQRHLQALEKAMAQAHEASLPESLRARHQVLRAEQLRLQSWQQWGGERARDELAVRAEALAEQALQSDCAQAPTGAEGMPEASSAPAPKLKLQSHADAIRTLRQRWKALDHVGGPANAGQWQRFDAALQTAYLPVAAHQALVKTARQDNLATRVALLDALEGLPLPDHADAAQASEAWRELLRELDRFRHAWRQLGPTQHTVPTDARDALQQRLQQAVARIEQPLEQVRLVAATVRETLIAQAEAVATTPGGAEALRRVRELQAAWQGAARQMPLARPVEARLWARFKTATDAVYAQREAWFAERDAELATHLAEREALLSRLSGLADDAPQAELARTLSEVEAGWRGAAALPRAASEALEGRFRAARDQVQQRLAAASRRRWQAQCDSLVARLALCTAREDGVADADAHERWAACGALPPDWELALTQRWNQPVTPGPLSSDDVDGMLLQLELTWDLPSAPEWQDARRQLKLQGLKLALEGRGAASQGQADGNADQALVRLLRQGQLSAAQRLRLQALIEHRANPHIRQDAATRSGFSH